MLVGSEIVLALLGSTSPGTGAAIFPLSGFLNRSTVLCFKVSVLERALGCCLDDCREEVGRRGAALGVIESLSSSQAPSSSDTEPLNEECSLSVPSLSQ